MFNFLLSSSFFLKIIELIFRYIIVHLFAISCGMADIS